MEFNAESIKAAFQDTTVAGMLGSLVSLRFMPGATWWARFSSAMTGLVVSFYGVEPALSWLKVSSQSGAGLAGFTLGFLGVHILSKALDYWKKTDFPELFTNLIKVLKGTPP